jgi:hypothetical protein
LLGARPGDSFYDMADQLKPLVASLIATNPSQAPGPETMRMGQGDWTVFYAPHIVSGSSAVGARFDPISYRLHADKITSNVRYEHPLLGSGWFNASGTFDVLQKLMYKSSPVCWTSVAGASIAPGRSA